MLTYAGVFASSSQLLRQVRAHYRKQYLRAISPLEALAGAQLELQFFFVLFLVFFFFNRTLPEAVPEGHIPPLEALAGKESRAARDAC